MIFNMNGGGTALNFRVVGGTSAPSDLKENTIWVNTSTAVSSWDFSATQPALRSVNKNLIVYPYPEKTNTTNGITYTVNSDGSITASGTATATAWFSVRDPEDYIGLEPGTYTLSGCPYAGGAGKVKMALRPLDGGSDITDSGSGVTFTLTKYTVFEIPIAIYAAAGRVSNIVFKPQIEKASSATSFVKGDATGQVWIQTGTASPVEFNALKKNGIQVYPMAAKQYVNGAWEKRSAESAQGGVWNEWDPAGALFWEGNQFNSLTGGWASGSVWDDSPATFTTSNNMLNISHSSSKSYSSNALKCTNKISLSGARVIKCNVAAMSGTLEKLDFCVKGSGELSNLETAAKVSIATTGEITLDVSSLSGSYYVYFFSYTTAKTFAYSIDRVWYE